MTQPVPIGRGDMRWLHDANAVVSELWDHFTEWAGDMPEPGSQAYTDRHRAFVIGARMMRRRAMLIVLQDIARRRPLDLAEMELMDRLVSQMIRHKRALWRWSPQEDAKILALIARRNREGRPKPYTRNGEVARLARSLGRSYMAVHRRMARLRNCSNAGSDSGG